MDSRWTARAHRDWLVLAIPYGWLLIFFLAPFALVLKISLSQSALRQPPYEPVFSWSDSFQSLLGKLSTLSLDSFGGLLSDSLYLESYISSVLVAAVSTIVTLLVAYPFALAIARSSPKIRPILLGLAIAPFWTSFLIRVYE